MCVLSRIQPLVRILGLFVAVLVAGCGGNDSSGGSGSSLGSLRVSLTDAPACGFDAVNVTVEKVRVHRSDSANENETGWTDIPLNPPKRINLLDYNDPTQPNGALASLGEVSLEAGRYTQVRLVLVPNNGSNPPNNSVVLSGTNSEVPVTTPSAVQSGIKLIHGFDVQAGERVDLLLDFDACQSIVKTGNGKYKLKPVIHVIPFVLNGIDGFVDTGLLGSHVLVTAQENGAIVRSTVPNASGRFFLSRLPAGKNYDVVVTADGHATAVIAGVPVMNSTSTTRISTDTQRIALAQSDAHRVSGTVTLSAGTDDESIVLDAKQALLGGPIVTVRTELAIVLDHTQTLGDYAYAVVLPTVPPLLGGYSNSLPIAMTQQATTIGGKYVVRATTEGFTSQSSSVDVSAADATQNFALIP